MSSQLPTVAALFAMGGQGPAIALFFAISGFVVTGAARHAVNGGTGWATFLGRRVRRVYPPFWASIVVVALLPFVIEGLSWLKTGQYVVREHRPSVAVKERVVVGEPLPQAVELYPVPADVGVKTEYRYSVVNNRTVLVDPRTRRVVQVIEE